KVSNLFRVSRGRNRLRALDFRAALSCALRHASLFPLRAAGTRSVELTDLEVRPTEAGVPGQTLPDRLLWAFRSILPKLWDESQTRPSRGPMIRKNRSRNRCRRLLRAAPT